MMPEPFQYEPPALKPDLSWLVISPRLPPRTIMSLPPRSSVPVHAPAKLAMDKPEVTNNVRLACTVGVTTTALPPPLIMRDDRVRISIPPLVLAFRSSVAPPATVTAPLGIAAAGVK